mmetsp:Transcript_25812/g.29517  ORF Transcript_25812/g.29517 Transcript_25812/m.29517 type:complete len:822 (-) Transcript_25812:60-2525(-)|eukprot:CAMPEP_0194191846 /NCGR_PEP_ID=MMETSP0154-20130528/68400_1 /TAXON_ID=1049557 /ORGANISM="Thalassiothrix antarctica, Strain L6-D1" /LENGTH=821 /DNA_ID=CAMNT_0038914843 /DNA_START=45 /DNA_END=2510 /DNA_ORIENTATION=-
MTNDEHSLDDLRQLANHQFSQGNYDAALSLYTAAIEKADAEHNKEALIINLSNRSATLYKMEKYEGAQADASQALDASSGLNLKASFRLAKAQIALKAFGAAVGTLEGTLEDLSEREDKASVERQIKPFNELLLEAKKEEEKVNEEDIITSIKNAPRGVSIREFIKGEELGVGNFSEILVCKHKKTGENFALKLIEKKQAADLAKRQHPNIYNEIQMERRILLERLPAHHNVIQMYHAFQNYNTLYYLMELHRDGGEMWNSMREGGKMVGCHRSLVKIYLAELLDALEHIHSHGIVHRDIKPENILFSNSGHVILIDFGTAKDLIQTDLNGPEFVGTPDFMSPEAVSGTASLKEADEAKKEGKIGADHTLDLYALGAVAFQLHTGMTPFWCPSPYLCFLKIKRGNLLRPWGIADDDAWDLISSLMKLEPNNRLGAECFKLSGNLKRTVVKKGGGYDLIRNHPYFSHKNIFDVPALDKDYKNKTPIPSLRDFCARSCAKLVQQDAQDLNLCDQHPPGDGSSHDMFRLDDRDRKCVMHYLERQKLLTDPAIFRRFFDSPIGYRLDKTRGDSRDYIGLTKMTDNHHKFPNPNENDPYADPQPIDPINIVQISNPLFVKEIAESCDEETQKVYLKLFKKCIARINRSRPKLVIVAGYISQQCRKLLARINDSIPVVMIDGSTFFSFWLSGTEFIALQSSELNEDGKQMHWIREELEQCRMGRYPIFVFVDSDPQCLPQRLMKYLARGKVEMVCGPVKNEKGLETTVSYEANEILDDISIKSTESDEDDADNHLMKVVGTKENGLRHITISDREELYIEFQPVNLS